MNTELIKVARKAAKAWNKSDAYGQASEIISMLCDELEKKAQPVATPPTVKDVLLERWRDDIGTYHMAVATIHRSVGGGFYTLDLKNSIRSRHTNLDEAIGSQIAYLNSPAEVEA